MHRYLALAGLLVAAPLTAQTTPPTDQATTPDTNRTGSAKPPMQRPMPMKDQTKMEGMDHAKMGGMGDMMKNTPANPYAEAGMAMHHKMMVVGTDASETWARQMIEHHRGAIAMSKIALTQAKDKELVTMAQSDIAMQEKDVASLQLWLKRHGKTAQ